MHSRTSSIPPVVTSSCGDGFRHGFEGTQAVATQELVAPGKGRCHAACKGHELPTRLPRVDPDDPVGEKAEPLHLAFDQAGIAAFPPVREDDDDCAACQPASAVPVVEALQGFAYPRATGPVPRRRGGTLDREVGLAAPEY